MKGLTTLIKLSKRTLDELRRKMVSLENQKAQLQLASRKLREELESEMAMASTQPDMARFFGDFAGRIKKRQEQIATEIKSLDNQMAALNNDISIAYGELKKFEIAKENAMKRKAEEQSRKDTIMLDEIASQQHRRKQMETSGE